MGKVFSGISKALFGGSNSTQQSVQQSSNQLDPRLFNMYNQNVGRATNVANNLGARQIADFSPQFMQALGLTQQSVGPNSAGTITTGQGVNAANRVASYSPERVFDGYTPERITAEGLLDVDINRYMNPFIDNVANNVMSDMDRSRQMVQMQNADAAARAGAFGGSRQGVLEAETNRGFFNEAGVVSDLLRAGAFRNAQEAATGDLVRRMEAARLNQAAGLEGNQQRMQAQGLNQAAGLTANQQRLAAGQALGALGLQQQQMGLQGSQQLAAFDQIQRERQQSILDAVRMLPIEQQALINEALGLNPAGGSGMVGTSTGSSSGASDSRNGIFPALFPMGI
jgi:hypothetical protein